MTNPVTRTTPATLAAEQEIATLIELAWGATAHRYAQFDSIDWWIEKDKRCVAYVEMKDRSHPFGKYPTTFLALRKWLALTLAALTGPKSLFVVRFTDGIYWVNVHKVDPTALIVNGRTDRIGNPNDIEPLIEVPNEIMEKVMVE
jgi:hypothetical protein